MSSFAVPSRFAWLDATRSPLLRIGWAFMREHLADRIRRSSGELAWLHAVRVATILRREIGISDPEVLTLALLHDVVEDTPVALEEMERVFGPKLTSQVVALTKPLLGPKAVRRDFYFRVITRSGDAVKLVKIVDYIDNLRSRRGGSREGSTRESALSFLSSLRAEPQSRMVSAAMGVLLEELHGGSHRVPASAGAAPATRAIDFDAPLAA